MPTWVYIYSLAIVFSHCYNVFDDNRLKKTYLLAGEVLDCICTFIIIFIAYDFLILEQEVFYASLCLIFNCVWSYHAYKHYFDFNKFKEDIHQSDIELEEKMGQKYDDFESSYDFDKVERQAKNYYIGTIIIVTLFALPYFYIYSKAIGFIN